MQADHTVASRRIADDFASKIESGELEPGARLPSERPLAESYGVVRNTVKAAMRLLQEAGMVDIQHGKGVFVRTAGPLIRLGSDYYSPRHRGSGSSPVLLECERAGKHGRFEVLSVGEVPAPADVAARLQLDEGAPVLRRKHLFWADEDPVYRMTTYIPWFIAAGTVLLEVDIPHPHGIPGVLKDHGYTMARLDDVAIARMATRTEMAALRLGPGVPVLDLHHISVRADGVPYELNRFVMRGDMSALAYNVPVE